MASWVEIDGARGEGGGQILRTSLALAMITGRALRMRHIRSGRARPGLRRQHLACVEAAAALCGAEVRGASLGSQDLDFAPSALAGGELTIAIGTAGSTTLVVQTILVPALVAGHPLRAVIRGGTHNPMAPPFEFLDRIYLPHLRAMGADVALSLDRHGFATGGRGDRGPDRATRDHAARRPSRDRDEPAPRRERSANRDERPANRDARLAPDEPGQLTIAIGASAVTATSSIPARAASAVTATSSIPARAASAVTTSSTTPAGAASAVTATSTSTPAGAASAVITSTSASGGAATDAATASRRASSSSLRPIEIIDASPVTGRLATVLLARLPTHIADRELAIVQARLGFTPDECVVRELHDTGPANVLLLEIERGSHRELVSSIGERGLRAEAVATRACDQLAAFLAADIPVGEHLADQLLLPLAVAGGGRFRTSPLSLHATTNIETIHHFLDVPITVERIAGADLVTIG